MKNQQITGSATPSPHRLPLFTPFAQVLDILHPGRSGVSKNELRERLCKMYDVKDENTVQVFGMKTAFGGGKTTGFGLIYETVDHAKQFEPKYRLQRVSSFFPPSYTSRAGVISVSLSLGIKMMMITSASEMKRRELAAPGSGIIPVSPFHDSRYISAVFSSLLFLVVSLYLPPADWPCQHQEGFPQAEEGAQEQGSRHPRKGQARVIC